MSPVKLQNIHPFPEYNPLVTKASVVAFNFHYPPHTIAVNPTKVTLADVLLTSLNHMVISFSTLITTKILENTQYITIPNKTYSNPFIKHKSSLELTELAVESIR